MQVKVILVYGMILLAGAAMGEGEDAAGGRRGATGGGQREKGLVEELGLSESKGAALREHMQSMHKRMGEFKQEHDSAQAALESLLDADSIDEAAVWKAVDTMNRCMNEMTRARVQSRMELQKSLTEEQRVRMRELRHEMKQRREKRMEKGRDRFQQERESFRGKKQSSGESGE